MHEPDPEPDPRRVTFRMDEAAAARTYATGMPAPRHAPDWQDDELAWVADIDEHGWVEMS